MNVLQSILLCCFFCPLIAQESFLDQTFGTKGRMNFAFLSKDNLNAPRNGIIETDGRLLLCGITLNSIDSTKTMGGLAVIKPNGRLDSTELINGKLPFDLNIRPVENISPQVIRANPNGTKSMSLTRGKTPFSSQLFLANLTGHFTFTPNSFSNAMVPIFAQTETDSILLFNHNLDVQADGKILISYRRQYQRSSTAAQVLLRLKPDGSRDSSFGTHGQIILDTGALNKQLTSSGVINNIDISLMKKNNVLVAGDTIIVTPGGNNSFLKMIRYSADGKPDNSFGFKGIVKNNVLPFSFRSSVVDTNDNIYVTGTSIAAPCVLKYKPNGVLDSSFANQGVFLAVNNLLSPTTIVLNQKQEPLLTGFNLNRQIHVLALKANGTANTLFGSNGSIIVPLNKFSNTPTDILVLPDESILIVSRLLFNDINADSNVEIIKLKSSSTTPVKSRISDSELTVFPNPAHGYITIESKQIIKRIELLDLSGKLIFQTSPVSNRIELPVLQTGLYILNAFGKNQEWIGRKSLIVE